MDFDLVRGLTPSRDRRFRDPGEAGSGDAQAQAIGPVLEAKAGNSGWAVVVMGCVLMTMCRGDPLWSPR